MPFSAGEGQLFQQNHEQFDFNIEFEQVFLSTIPSALFILVSLWRIIYQARKPAVVNAPIFRFIKAV
jgi:di/tricarboxylate transporter